ncbi:hypothetical protein CAP35_14040 [Chitinophagaceae bacterium IBVUCB1]|nr:hypothetical protein CAP35_14040 [Chitinophagaceae bacterium IBVUCB1]
MFSKTHISRALSAGLILLIACNMAGFVVWQTVRVCSYRYVRQHRQAIAMRDTLRMPVAVFEDGKSVIWHKNDEIAYGDEMFDIKQQYKQGDDIVLIGHYDRFENKLFKALYKMLGGKDQPDKQHTQPAWHFDAVMPIAVHIQMAFTQAVPNYTSLLIFTEQQGYTALPYTPPDAMVV